MVRSQKADSFAALRNDMQKSKGKDGAGLCAFPPIAKTRRWGTGKGKTVPQGL